MSTTTPTRRVTPFEILETKPLPSGITKLRQPPAHDPGATSYYLYNYPFLPGELVSKAMEVLLAASDAGTTTTETLTKFFEATLADFLDNNPQDSESTAACLCINTTYANRGSAWGRSSATGLPTRDLNKVQSTYAITLLGPPDAVLRPSGKASSMYEQLGKSKMAVPDFSTLPRHPLESGQIYRFTTGQTTSPIQRSPGSAEDRVFLSVGYYLSSIPPFIMSSTAPITPFSILKTIPPPSGITEIQLQPVEGRPSVVTSRTRAFMTSVAGSAIRHSNSDGTPMEELLPAAMEFILALSDADSNKLKETLNAFFKATAIDCYYNHPAHFPTARGQLFITINRFTDTFHWHQDHPALDSGNRAPGRVYSRYSMTLLGPPTYVLKPGPVLYAPGVIAAEYHERVQENYRFEPREAIRTGEIYRFTVGERDSPIHSTPKHTEDRIFLSVLYH